ncbi:MAG: TOBE domain-containing protein, partial [Betaproteobacteria bacterium]
MADRIVVMHDGIVEQIGTPLELFDQPGNLFVAQFIGSPAMNVFEGTLRRDGTRSWVEGEGQKWPVPNVGAGKDGQAVHYGIRPGDIVMRDAGTGIAAVVEVVEPTGAETEIIVKVGEIPFTVVLHGRTDVKPDQGIGLDIAIDKVHLFDKASGKRLD